MEKKALTVEVFRREIGDKWNVWKGNWKEEKLDALLNHYNFEENEFKRELLRIELDGLGFFKGGSKGNEINLPIESLSLKAKNDVVKSIERFESPSVTSAKPTTLNKKRYKYIHYHRRSEQPLHTSLYHPILADLYDNLHGLSNAIPTPEDCNDANNLSRAMSPYYSKEEEMYTPFHTWANEAGLSLSSILIQGARTDGSLEIKTENLHALIVNSEIKHNGCNADLQNIIYYCKYWAKETKLLEHTVCPTILLSLQGTDLTVSGAVFINAGVVCDYYYSVSLLPIDHDTILRTNLARTVMSIKKAAKSLVKFYNKFDKNIPKNESTKIMNDFPYLNSINEYQFTYVKQITNHSLVFEAKAGNTDIIVKFTRSYSKNAHESCPIAPKLLAYAQIKGGWHVAAMEKVDAVTGKKLTEKQIDKLKKGIATMHRSGYVHGDLRPANVLVDNNGKIYLVDFDWAGEINKAIYPLFMNYDNNYPTSAKGGNYITKEDDIAMLNKFC